MSVAGFEFATATRIIFGAGKIAEIGVLAKSFGSRALVVIGKSAGAVQRVEPVLSALTQAGVDYDTFSVAGEPTLDTVRAGRKPGDLVIAFGGGSVLDTGKAIAALLTNPGDPLDYVEVIGKGRVLTNPPVPFIAIPTTAGTGAEVTRNAVLGSPEHKVKVSLRSPLMLPRIALVDPEVTSAPPACRLDALTQLIEPFVSNKANPLTDAICREGMRRWREGGNENWALAAMFSGLALANAGLGAVHGFAGPLGGMYDAPHGALCAALLPAVLEVNERRGVERIKEVRAIVGDIPALVRELQIPGLRAYGVPREDFPVIIEKAKAASSMKGNPVGLTDVELMEILDRAY